MTAVAIAKKVGIIGEGHETKFEQIHANDRKSMLSIPNTPIDEEAIVITGSELRNMDEKELDNIIMGYDEIVFARTSPQQKLLIVESCQRLGEVVAVTGKFID